MRLIIELDAGLIGLPPREIPTVAVIALFFFTERN
jgi:hypothetical protein